MGTQTNDNVDEDWILARKGIHMLLNNQMSEAETLFNAHRKKSMQMAAGHCFVTFMNALMTFDEDKLSDSIRTLKAMERRCVQEMGWLKSVRDRVLGPSGSPRKLSEEDSVAIRLEQQIILADSQVCLALLTFLQHDLGSYVRGGWALRKAWRVYQQTYTQLLEEYKKSMPPTPDLPYFPSTSRALNRDESIPVLNSPDSEWFIPPHVNNHKQSASSTPATPTSPEHPINGTGAPTRKGFFPISISFQSLVSPFSGLFSGSTTASQPPPKQPLDGALVARLLSAVSFGYGVFQLCVSLLPPSLLRLVHLLGFDGDRQTGISALLFARRGQDMRAPLATLALLWYHTVVRPFFALDGSNIIAAGVEAAQELIDESQEEFGTSSLFLFFTGRVCRLKSDLPGALESYSKAVAASPQHEVRLLCLHEMGWCYLLQLDWLRSQRAFLALRSQSRWSRCFYAYAASLCTGALGNVDSAVRLAAEVPRLASTKTGNSRQLEAFIVRRVRMISMDEPNAATPDRISFLLLAYELILLWNAMPSCSVDVIQAIAHDCNSEPTSPVLESLRLLLHGASCASLLLCDEAVVSLRKVCDMPKNADGNDAHVWIFAAYELGVLLCKKKETREEGRRYLLKARDDVPADGYDFESRLSVRIHAALEKYSPET